MAKKRVSGVGAIDRQIKATKEKISKIKKAKRQKALAAKKARKLASLRRQLRNAGKRK